MPKRKASETTKKTKAQIRAEGKARAKAWAEETAKKKKVQNDAEDEDPEEVEPIPPTKKRRVASPKRAAKKPAAKKVPAKSSPVATATGTPKSSKKSRRELSKQRAKAWAEGEGNLAGTPASNSAPAFQAPPVVIPPSMPTSATAPVSKIIPQSIVAPVAQEKTADEISNMVLANALNGHVENPPSVQRPDLPDLPESVAFYSPAKSEAFEELEEIKTSKSRPMGLVLVFLVALASIGVGVLNMHGKSPLSMPKTADEVQKGGKPPCFISNEKDTTVDPEYPEAVLPPLDCDESVPRVKCPRGGKCADGVLQSCKEKNAQVAESGNLCVPNQSANETLKAMETLLVEWTTEDLCTFQGCSFAMEGHKKAPVFPISELESRVPNLVALLTLNKVDFIYNKTSQGLVVGLSDNYMDNKLILPWWCFFMTLGWSYLTSLIRFAGAKAIEVAKFSWLVFMRFPLPASVCLGVILLVRYRRKYLKDQKNFIKEVANVKKLAYEKLMSNPTLSHAVLHLRDEIADDLYPTSRRGKDRIILKVWKQVVAEIKYDNRVEKGNVLMQGKPRETWQWVAAATGSTRHVTIGEQ